ncbi:hypothetical protein HZS_3873 [Henneguya salminicola]|nr:hypothetical protein HZS_3873 [Henneguya salminicola]
MAKSQFLPSAHLELSISAAGERHSKETTTRKRWKYGRNSIRNICPQNLTHIHKIATMHMEPEMRDIQVIYIWGESGVGKSHMARDLTLKPN